MIEVYLDPDDEDGVYLVYDEGDAGIYRLSGGLAHLTEVNEVPADAIPLLAQDGDRPPTGILHRDTAQEV
jgi:hypothetical protein